MAELRRRRFRRWLFATGMMLAQCAQVIPVHAQSERKEVLVLYSTRRDAQFSLVGESELPRTLDVGLARNLDYYSEFMDLAMFPEPAETAFRDFLAVKYQGRRFDVVIALQDLAIEFVIFYRDTLFRDTPVVFLTNRASINTPTRSTGIIHERDYGATLGFIRQLQPDVERVFVVTGAARGDRNIENALRRQLQAFDSGLSLDYLSGLATGELKDRLANLPGRSAVYYVIVTEDGAGEQVHPLEYVDLVAAAANAPTYCWVDSAMGRGIVGGSLYRQKAAIDRVGELALQVLRGAAADSIPIATLRPNQNEVDWRQLRRWGISEARLPTGTLIRFREPSLWDRYWIYVIAALTLLITQSVLIAGLLIQRRRRRRAEKELRRNETALRWSYERNRDLGVRLLRAQETERARIARELHDDICQRMLLLTIELEAVGRAKPGEAHAAEALKAAHDISTSLHELSHRLHPTRLRLIGLVAALEQLCLEVSRAGITVAYTHNGVPTRLAPDVMLCLFRVVQEALQNAIKYSKAQRLTVDLSGGSDGLVLTIDDNGAGFDLNSAWAKGVGLISMVERLEAIGGTLDIRSSPGAGTRLNATIPAQVLQTPTE
jgi:signal transduction histidine kinase